MQHPAQYHGLDRLDVANGAWGSGSFDYDTLGNLTYKTVGGVGSSYSYNSTTNRLTTVSGGYSFSYDDRGNVTYNGKRAFSFNRANQLISSDSVSYAYDGYNRRIKQQTAAGVSYSLYNSAGQLMMRQNPAALRSFSLYLGNNLIAERDIGSSNTIRYQHTDVLGSVIAESNTAGTITGTSVYQPFGERIGGQKTGLGFTGHLEDTDIGLTYMQQRYYDPVIGRFYSNDPVGFSADNPMMFNRYAYANNNPYKFTDPDGRASDCLLCRPDYNTRSLMEKGAPVRQDPVGKMAEQAQGGREAINSRISEAKVNGKDAMSVTESTKDYQTPTAKDAANAASFVSLVTTPMPGVSATFAVAAVALDDSTSNQIGAATAVGSIALSAVSPALAQTVSNIGLVSSAASMVDAAKIPKEQK